MDDEMFALRVGLDRMRALLTRLNSVCLEVMEWADAQDEERRPEWVEKLERVLEERP